MKRDLDRENAFLTAASPEHVPFVEQAEQRLAAGEDTFGGSWAWIGITRHLTELLEEAADLGAWAALADQALDTEAELSDLHIQQIRAVLAVAARCGARAHISLSQALNSIERTGVAS